MARLGILRPGFFLPIAQLFTVSALGQTVKAVWLKFKQTAALAMTG
jgi:hypothetical protein